MAVISLLAGTSAWAQSDFSATETSNVTLTAGTNGSTCTVNGKDGIKVGTSKAGGDMSVTVPAGTTHLHVHAAAWKGVTGLSLNISGATTSPSSVDLTADSGVSNNSPFTLSGSASSYYFVVELSNITAETTLKFTSSTGKRFVVWGVNASGGPTLTDNDLALTGAPIALSFDLYNNSDAQVINYTTSSTGAVSIADSEYATFIVDQDNKTITVTPTAVTPSTQTITVNQAADDTYKAGSVTFTINVTNSNPAVNNISDITAAGTYKVRGTIVAKSQRGFIVGDGTGYVYYYNQNYTQADYNIGDMVELNGSVVAYGGVFEFNNTTTVTAATSSNYVAENPTVLSGADMDTRVASTTPTQLSSYVQYEGTLTVSGTYYNITSIDGASTAMGSISYPLNTDFTSLNGKKVKVTGYYVGISSSKYYNTMIGSIEEVVVTTPTLIVEPAVVNVPYTGGNGDFTVSPSNVDNAFDAYITYYDPANTENTASSDPEWLNVGYDYSNLSLSYSVTEENTTGAARTACFKYSVMCDGGVALSNMITVTQAAYIADYATLPFTFDGGRADIETTAGLTQEGLDSDYASSPKLKFNGTGDYVILKFNERPGKLTFDIKGNSFSGGTFTVQTSEDGVTYTDLETYDALADMQSEELNNLGEDVRYIKWVYTNKSSGNVALGNIALAKYSAPAPSITIDPATYTMDAKAGGGEIPVVSENLASDPQLAVVFVEADGVTPATYDWITATINSNGNIYGQIEENTGDARTAYFKVHGVDADNNDVYSNLVTFTQEAPVAATPTIVFNPESIDFDANSGYRTIGGDYFQLKDFDSTPSLEILYYESDGDTEKQGGYDWLTADFNSNNQIGFTWGTNPGAARTAYLKIHAVGTTVYSNLFTINQAAYVAPALTQINLTKTLVFDTSCGLASGGYAVNDELTELSGTFEGDASATRFGGFVIKDSYINGGSIQMKANTGSIAFPAIESEYGFDVTVAYKTNDAIVYISGVSSTEASSGIAHLIIATGSKYCQITSITLTPKTSEVPPTVDVEEPTITEADGLVEIIAGSDNAQVIYTTDGTDPTYNPLNGTVYTEPFNITVDTTIKAIGVDADGNASDVVEVAVTAPVVSGVKYYKVTSTDQLEEGVDYLLVYEGEAGEGAAAYGGLNSYTGYSIGKSVALKHIGGSVVTITDEEVVPVTLKSRSEDGTKWAMRDATGWIAAVNGYNNLHGDKTEDDAIWTFDFTADANKQIFQEFTATSTRYLQYNTSSPRFAGYTGTQSAVYLYKAASYNVSVGATGYATLYYGTKNLVVPENVEAYTYTVKNGKLEESYLYSTNEVIPAGTGVVLKAPAGEYKFAVTTEAGLEDTDNLLFGFDTPSTTTAPAAGDYLFYLLGVDNGKVGFYWGKADGAAFKSGAHKAYLAVPTEQASGLRGFSFDGSVVGINTIGVDMPEGNAYDLQGRRVQQLQKNGLYIVDGKKMLAK